VTRSVACVDAQLQPAPATACKGLTVPAAQRICNAAPCVGHSWQVNDSQCSSETDDLPLIGTASLVNAQLQPAQVNACKGLTVSTAQWICNTAPCVGHSWQVRARSARNNLLSCVSTFKRLITRGTQTCTAITTASESPRTQHVKSALSRALPLRTWSPFYTMSWQLGAAHLNVLPAKEAEARAACQMRWMLYTRVTVWIDVGYGQQFEVYCMSRWGSGELAASPAVEESERGRCSA